MAVLPQGSVVTVEKPKKPERRFVVVPDRTVEPAGSPASDLMTCQDAAAVWQKMIADGDVSAYFLLGLAHDQLGDFSRSEEDFNACMWYYPESVEAVENRGFARLKLGQTQTGGTRFFGFDSHAAQAPRAYGNRANARLALGNGEGALADCDEALKLDPESLLVLVNRGSAERMLGHFDKAVADYERAAAIDDNLVRREPQLRLAAGGLSRPGSFATAARPWNWPRKPAKRRTTATVGR